MVGTPHVARVAVQLAYPDPTNVLENVFYLFDETDAIFGDPELTAATVLAEAIATYVALLTSNTTVIGATFEDVRTVPFGGVAVSPVAPTVGGYGSAGTLPSCTAIAITKHTALLGRSGHGRMFFPVFSELQKSAPDTVSSPYAASAIAAMVAFQAAVQTVPLSAQLGIVSYRHAGAPRAAGLFSQITSWGISDLAVDTQRRRLLLHNRHR